MLNPILLLQALNLGREIYKDLRKVPKEKRKGAKEKIRKSAKKHCDDESCSAD